MRTIQPELFKFIDDKLKNNPLAQHAIETTQPRILLAEAAKACVGIKEATGRNDGKFVQLIQKTVDGRASYEAWCMCFVQSEIAYVERKLGIKSPLFGTEHCMTLWRWVKSKRPDLIVKHQPAIAAIPIWNYSGTDNGHTGFYLYNAAGNKFFTTAEGNTSGFDQESEAVPGTKVEREGNGAFFNLRSFEGTGKMQLKGFIKPF